MSRYPELEIINAMYDILSVDTSLSTRTIDTVQKTTEFYKLLSLSELITHKRENQNEELRVFNVPIIVINNKGTDFTQDGNASDRIKPSIGIDILVSHYSLPTAKEEAQKIAYDIKDIIAKNKGLLSRTGLSRLQKITPMGFLKVHESEYQYYYRCEFENILR
jgi:hypothetical protein